MIDANMQRKTSGPLRVLYIDHTALLGGGELALVNLLSHLNTNLIVPIVLLFSPGPLVERLEGHAEVHVLTLSESVIRAKKDRLGWASLFQIISLCLVIRQVWRVAQFARKERIDLIHTNSLKADIIGGIAGRITRIPVIWHIRDRIEADYLPKIVVTVFRYLARTIPNFIIANSSSTLATLHLKDPSMAVAIASGVDTFKDQSIKVVHDGVVVKDRLLSDQNLTFNKKVGLIGRISPWKGQHIFIEAAALLRERHPNVVFEIIGAPLFSEVGYEQQLHALCARLALAKRVHFVGFVTDVQDRIAQLSIVVHASTTGEPFGQVIIEGMVQEKPIVATNGGGVPEIVADGLTGILVPMGDPSKMADAIDYLLRNPEAAANMGALGRKRVLERFTIDATARKVESVYQQLHLASRV